MSIADKVALLTSDRDNIRTSLVNKGVDASDHGFSSFAADIDSIETSGKPIPTYTFREMPEDWKYFTSLKKRTDDSAFLCFKGAGDTMRLFGTTLHRVEVYGGEDGITPLFKWRWEVGWSHYDNGEWILNNNQDDGTMCDLTHMDLDNYPLNVGTFFSNYVGKPVYNDENIGTTELFTVIAGSDVGASSVPNLGIYPEVVPGASGNDSIYIVPVVAYSGDVRNFAYNTHDVQVCGLEFIELFYHSDKISENTNYQFSKCSKLKKAIVPEGTTKCGTHMFFDDCNLELVELPNTLTSIGLGCFSGCWSLRKAVISEGVDMIGNSAFYNCSSLEDIVLPKTLVSIGQSAFSLCTSLKKATFHNTINYGIIPAKLFYGCSRLEELNNDDNTTEIGDSAFYGCKNLKNFYFSKNLTKIGASTFDGCECLATVDLPDTVASIGASAFKGMSSLRKFTLPEGVKALPSNIFSGCDNLLNVSLHENVTSIGASAFNGCSSLKSIDIPSLVKTIPQNCFSGCRSLRKVDIGQNIKTISSNAFSNCTSMRYVKLFPSTPPTLSSISAFNSTSDYFKIFVPYESYNAYQAATNWSSATNYIVYKQCGWGYFEAGTVLPTTVGTHAVRWYTLNDICNVLYNETPTVEPITTADHSGDYYCVYE